MAGSQISPVSVVLIVMIAIGVIFPVINFRKQCMSQQVLFQTEREQAKKTINDLHEQCQTQLDEHLTAKQESFDRKIQSIRDAADKKEEEQKAKFQSTAAKMYEANQKLKICTDELEGFRDKGYQVVNFRKF